MTGRGRGKKRKSEDFICEINDEDLSPDEDHDDGSPSCKMIKIDGEMKETSNTEENSNDNENKSASESVILLTDESNDFKITEPESQIGLSKKSSDKQNPTMNTLPKVDTSEVIEINDNGDDASKSIILIEDPISVMVVSDDEEEGEITEELQVIDEVSATPQQKLDGLVNETLENDNALSVPDGEFHVVEEIGPSPRPQEEDNLIKITFKCEKTMSQYGHLLVQFFQSFPELQVEKSKLCMTIKETESFDETRTPKKRNKRKKKAKKELFVVDTNPSSNDDNSQFLQFRYNSKFEISEQQESEEQAKTSSRVCFNCDGDHALKDCSIPRNMRRINQARQQFMDKYKTVRYHVEPNEKLADLKPGVISENLRAALGLNKNEIPNYIYKMRGLGYPPGWLEEAKVSPSDLSLFNIDGKKVESRKSNTTSIDPSKIIDYPGFNMPPKKGSFDDFKRYRVPPYTKAMHKSSMIKYYENLFQKEKSSTTSSDLETVQENLVEKKDVPKSEKNEGAASADCSSLVDLEEKKKELLDELNTNLDQTKPIPEESKDVTENSVESKEEIKTPVVAVKNTEFGTPILKSSSPYSRLPNPDNFSVGVSPVIDFENLPNSTGKYEELSKVLSKVRMTMKNIL